MPARPPRAQAEEKEIFLYGGMVFDVKRVFINKLDATLAALKNCERLSLSTNQIDRMAPFTGMEKLRLLSLSRNALKKIERLEDVSETLEELWLSYNLISTLDGLGSCQKLQVIYLVRRALLRGGSARARKRETGGERESATGSARGSAGRARWTAAGVARGRECPAHRRPRTCPPARPLAPRPRSPARSLNYSTARILSSARPLARSRYRRATTRSRTGPSSTSWPAWGRCARCSLRGTRST